MLARTATIDRFVIRSEVPGTVVETISDSAAPKTRTTGSGSGTYAAWNAFREEFLADLRFDDPGQMPPRNGGNNWMRLPLPGTAAARHGWRHTLSLDQFRQHRRISPLQ